MHCSREQLREGAIHWGEMGHVKDMSDCLGHASDQGRSASQLLVLAPALQQVSHDCSSRPPKPRTHCRP